MKLVGDYHTHTIYSHGKGTIEENVLAGIDAGLKEIGISDHGSGHVFFGIKRDKLPIMRAEIDEMNDKYGDKIKVLMGVEANFLDFNGNLDVLDSELKYFDYIACGYHYGIIPKGLNAKYGFWVLDRLQEISKSARNQFMKMTTDSLIKATYNYDIKFITHPGAKYPVDIVRLFKEMNPNTLLEINEKNHYLNMEQLLKLKDLGGNFIINSDAHHPSKVSSVDRCLERIKKAGIGPERIVNLGE